MNDAPNGVVNDPLSVVLATGGYDNTIRFWEAWSGICIKSVSHPTSQINRLAISPNKRSLAVAGCAHVRVYDVAIATSHAAPSAMPLPANSERTAAQQAQAQVQAGLFATFNHTANVTSLAWHCEGKWLVTGCEDGGLRVWDVRSGSLTRTYEHKVSINDVTIHPNQGEIIACDQSGAVKIWDLAADTCTHELLPEEDVPQRSVNISSDGRSLVTGNNHGNVFIWDMVTGGDYSNLRARARWNAHKRYCLKVLFSPDCKQVATCSADTFIKLWTLPTAVSPSPGSDASSRSSASSASSVSSSSVSLSAAGRPSGANFSALNPVATSTLGDRGSVTRSGGSRANAADGVAGRPAGGVDPLDPDPSLPWNPTLDKTLYGHQRWVWDMAFSADSAYLVSASSDHSAKLWELASGQTVRQYAGHSRPCVAVALNDIGHA